MKNWLPAMFKIFIKSNCLHFLLLEIDLNTVEILILSLEKAVLRGFSIIIKINKNEIKLIIEAI